MKNNKRMFILLVIIIAILPILFLCIITLKSTNSFNFLEIKGKFSMALPKDFTKQVSEDDGNSGVYRSNTIALWYQYGDRQSCETFEWHLKEEKLGINIQKNNTKINGKTAYLYYYDDSIVKFYYNNILNLYETTRPIFYVGKRAIFFPNTDKSKVLTIHIEFRDPKDRLIVDKIISSIQIN